MDFPKYDGNIHPTEWINDMGRYFALKNISYVNLMRIAISLVDPIISLPDNAVDVIDNPEKLLNVLKEDISFTVFKNTNKRMLQSLKYVPENEGDSISIEFYKKMENVDSKNKLIKEFEDFAIYLSNLIVNKSIVALKHVATGKYLSSIEDLCYKTGSKTQLVFVGSTGPGSNSLWKIKSNKELISYTDTFITLKHDKSKMFLGINCGSSFHYSIWDNNDDDDMCLHHTSPSTNNSEVGCNKLNVVKNWEFNHAKVESHQGFLKSNDIINLSIKKTHDKNNNPISNGQIEYLLSHDVRFTIENDTFQEVCCHNEILGGNDEWCIELIKQYNWT